LQGAKDKKELLTSRNTSPRNEFTFLNKKPQLMKKRLCCILPCVVKELPRAAP